MERQNKLRPRSGTANFNNLVNIQPLTNIGQTTRSNLPHFALFNIRSLNEKATFLKDYVVISIG